MAIRKNMRFKGASARAARPHADKHMPPRYIGKKPLTAAQQRAQAALRARTEVKPTEEVRT